jgi:hypothetical protein
MLALLDSRCPVRASRPRRWTPTFLFEFLRNFPNWVRDDLFNPASGGTRARLRFHAKTGRRRLCNLLRRGGADSDRADVEERFDTAVIPNEYEEALEIHMRALRAYVPRPYPGPVTLIRARTRPLFRLDGWDLGWTPLAAGGLEVISLPGIHATILKEPYDRALAARLRACLNQAGASRAAGSGASHDSHALAHQDVLPASA